MRWKKVMVVIMATLVSSGTARSRDYDWLRARVEWPPPDSFKPHFQLSFGADFRTDEYKTIKHYPRFTPSCTTSSLAQLPSKRGWATIRQRGIVLVQKSERLFLTLVSDYKAKRNSFPRFLRRGWRSCATRAMGYTPALPKPNRGYTLLLEQRSKL